MSTINFYLREKSIPADNREKAIFPVLTRQSVAKALELSRKISYSSTVSAPDIKAVLEAFAEVVSMELATGRTVEIPEFGTFTVRLRTTKKITNLNDKNAAQNLRVSGVVFRPKKSFLQRIGRPRFHCIDSPHADPVEQEREELEALLRAYFNETGNAYLTRAEFQRITGLGRTKSCEVLRELTEDNFLIKKGYRNAPCYILGEGVA